MILKCDICGCGGGRRTRTGPTGNNDFLILVDQCYRCGALYPCKIMTYEAEQWVKRYNERMKKQYEMMV